MVTKKADSGTVTEAAKTLEKAAVSKPAPKKAEPKLKAEEPKFMTYHGGSGYVTGSYRVLVLGDSPEKPGFKVVFNGNMGVKEVDASKLTV